MKKVRTVKGDIAPAELGITSMHEHTVSDFSEMFARIKAYMPPMPESMKKTSLKISGFSMMADMFYAKMIIWDPLISM